MSDKQTALLITELSRLNEVLESDWEARNLDGIRSHIADLRRINEDIHRLLNGPTMSLRVGMRPCGSSGLPPAILRK